LSFSVRGATVAGAGLASTGFGAGVVARTGVGLTDAASAITTSIGLMVLITFLAGEVASLATEPQKLGSLPTSAARTFPFSSEEAVGLSQIAICSRRF
jgi:hypothetical protein